MAVPEEEFHLLRSIIERDNETLAPADQYRFSQGEIKPCSEGYEYKGKTNRVPFIHESPQRIDKEEDLRVFFSANAGREALLDTVLNPTEYGKIIYIANETKCSFGMRSIDLLFLTDKNTCLLLELKNDFGNGVSILEQLREYARWIASYKKTIRRIVPILILREARLYPARRAGYKFKHLSKEDFHNGQLSPWYVKTLGGLGDLRTQLAEQAIPRVQDLQTFVFKTNQHKELESFTPI